MKLDIDRIKQHTGCSEEEFAHEMGISIEELQQYIKGIARMSDELLSDMCCYTGLSAQAGGLFVAEPSHSFTVRAVAPENTFEPAKEAKTSLVEYIKQGLQDFSDSSVKYEIAKLESFIKTLRKPRITFAGRSDAGKSTLINMLLGTDKMPTDFTPTTSIIVHIKHIDDKPSFISEDVWIFGNHTGEQWDSQRLDDEAYCKEHVIAKGDYSLLSTFGTHQSEEAMKESASSAVTFIDSPLLKDCDILDVPGFAVSSEDDAIHKFNTQENATDILIYLSVANNFLQEIDQDYLRDCIKVLRPVEKQGINNLEKLGNLFILASQAGTVEHGNYSKLQTILQRQSRAISGKFAFAAKENGQESLLPVRTSMTGYTYSEDDIHRRFFTFEKDLPRLCSKFRTSFTELAQNLPRVFYKEFRDNLQSLIDDSSDIIKQRVKEWEDALDSQGKYANLLREAREKEPARKLEQQVKNAQIHTVINDCCLTSKQDARTKFVETITVDHLVNLMKELEIRDKKEDKEDFASKINESLLSGVQITVQDQTKKYTEALEGFLAEYDDHIKEYGASQNIPVNFRTKENFALGLGSLGVFGASAAWLTNSLTAFGVFHFGALMGWSSVFAVGGMLALGLGSLIVGSIAIVRMITWRKSFAKAIVDAYEKENYLDTVFSQIEKYWDETAKGFDAGVDNVEKTWNERLSEYEKLADEKSIPLLREQIAEANRGLDFFTKIPMHDIG